MSVRFLLTSAIILTLLRRCRPNPHLQVYIDSMNAEKRLLEDTLYELQYDYETKSRRSRTVAARTGRSQGGPVPGAAGGSGRWGRQASYRREAVGRSGRHVPGDSRLETAHRRTGNPFRHGKKPQDDTPEGNRQNQGTRTAETRIGRRKDRPVRVPRPRRPTGDAALSRIRHSPAVSSETINRVTMVSWSFSNRGTQTTTLFPCRLG